MFNRKAIRVAAFDLDGTLLDLGVMSKKVREALVLLRESGIETIIATGRDWCQIAPEWRELFTYCITSNGASIRRCSDNAIISSYPLNTQKVLKIIEVMDSQHAGYFLYHDGNAECTGNAFALVNKKAPRINRENFLELFNTREHAEHSLLSYEKDTERTVFKIQSYYPTKAASLVAADEIKKLGKFEVVVMHHDSVEITAKGISKAGGLWELGKIAGFAPENIIAFGDSGNDEQMLSLAGYAVAMDNGEECVKKLADKIAPDVKEDGVATVLKELFDLKK